MHTPSPPGPPRDPGFASVCVFAGSSPGLDPRFVEAARGFGRVLAERRLTLVYGGGHVGLMGALADGALAAGGHVVGVIPRFLQEREAAHLTLPELHVVGSMHERKALMAEKADAFVAIPGGIGTLEEFFEVWTWTQLGAHRKPVGLWNLHGFYDKLIGFLDGVVEYGFLRSPHRAIVAVESDPERLLGRLAGMPVAPGETAIRGEQM